MKTRLRTLWRRLARNQLVWFVLLWVGGVVGTALLVLPFHLLVVAAKG